MEQSKKEALLKRAIRMYNAAYCKIKTFEQIVKEQNEILFVITWEDTLENLNLVLNAVKRSTECPNIIAYKISDETRKMRRDVYVLSEDNLKFRQLYYETLQRLQEEYQKEQENKNKQKVA